MTIEEELQTAYANLKGHQDRSIGYIKTIDEQRSQIEQLTVQLAGCMCAAQGSGSLAKKGDYGWSPAYQAIVDLRRKYDRE